MASSTSRSTTAATARAWPALPYERWRARFDTLHAHTQVLGKPHPRRVLAGWDDVRRITDPHRTTLDFARKPAAVETVTLAFENGSWSVSEYSVN